MIDIAISAQVMVWLIFIGVFLVSGQASLFHPVTWYLAFHGLVFVLRPILVHFFGFDFIWNYMRFQPSDEIFVRTLAVSSLGLVVLVVACLMTSRGHPSFSGHPAREFSLPQRRALLVVTLLLLPLIGYSIFFTASGSAQGELVGGTFINTNSVGYLNDAQFALMPLLCIWLAVTRFHWLNLLPAILYIGYRSWGGWARFTIVLFLLMVAATYCWQRQRRWMPLWSVAAAVPIFLLFNLIGHNRDVFKQWLSGEEVRTVQYDPGMDRQQKLKAQFDNPDAANFDSLAYILAVVPERTGTYTFGAQYLQIFTEPIPRLLWKGKPAGAPVAFFDLNAYGNFVGLTPSLAGDGWMSGGWFGLIVTMALVGGFLGWAHRWFWNHVENNLAALFYLTALPVLAQWYRDGGISMAKFMLWNWLPLLMWGGLNWLMGQRQMASYSILLPRGIRIRLVQAGEAGINARRHPENDHAC
jgi:hypothetical protein